MKISIIIPTHNRADSLRATLESVLACAAEANVEIIVVDNNSSDCTKEVVQQMAGGIRYVFERSTSFSKARNTGGAAATGDILLYLDDDVLMQAGSLGALVRGMASQSNCGVVAGRIKPRFLAEPPPWTLGRQSEFNGWSLLEVQDAIGEVWVDVEVAAGPMLAVRKVAFDAVGGFPPDTVGVETNTGAKLFRKLYVGPGDYGLCRLVQAAGWRICGCPVVAVEHVIPAVRFTRSFWRSRVIGEGYQMAVTARLFLKRPAWRRQLRRAYELTAFERQREVLATAPLPFEGGAGVSRSELKLRFHRAYLEMDRVLWLHPQLADLLWRVGAEGVANENYDAIVAQFPDDFRRLIRDEVVYDDGEVREEKDRARVIEPLTHLPLDGLRRWLGNLIVFARHLTKGATDVR